MSGGTKTKKFSFLKKSDIATVIVILVGFLAAMFVAELIGGQFKFFTITNWLNILMQNSVVGIMAAGMTLVMIAGGIDLSVGYLNSLGGILAAKVVVDGGAPVVAAILAAIAVCVGLEALMGWIIAKLKVEPFIITLGGSICFQGVALLICKSREIVTQGQFAAFKTSLIGDAKTASGLTLSFPVYVVIFLVVAVVIWLMLKYTKYGRQIYAVGANPSAAFLSGINVTMVKFSTYVINGALVGLGSILLLSRVGTAIITNGASLEIDVIAAVVIGGVAMSGGKGNGLGTLLGVILLGAITNAMNVLKLQSEWQYVAKGAIIIAAVAIGAVSALITARNTLRRQKAEALNEQGENE